MAGMRQEPEDEPAEDALPDDQLHEVASGNGDRPGPAGASDAADSGSADSGSLEGGGGVHEPQSREPQSREPQSREPRPRRKRRLGFVRSRLREIWLNLQVWIPFLINPFERRRMLRLHEHDRLQGRDCRHDLDWSVELPRQCWKTGDVVGLEPCVFERRLRSFERPLAILGVMFLGLMVVSTLSCLLGPWLTPMLYAAILLLGLIVLAIKSWRENVRLTIWSRPEHVEALNCPDMVVHNDHLFLHLPNTDLARASAAAVREGRYHRQRPADPRLADEFDDR